MSNTILKVTLEIERQSLGFELLKFVATEEIYHNVAKVCINVEKQLKQVYLSEECVFSLFKDITT